MFMSAIPDYLIIEMAKYMIMNSATVRQVGNEFLIPKSTVHEKLTTRLEKIDKKLYYQVKEILKHNESVRHIRGGEATKMMYLLRKKAKK